MTTVAMLLIMGASWEDRFEERLTKAEARLDVLEARFEEIDNKLDTVLETVKNEEVKSATPIPAPAPPEVVLYTGNFYCQPCENLKSYLKSRGIKPKIVVTNTGSVPRLEYQGRTITGFDQYDPAPVDNLLGLSSSAPEMGIMADPFTEYMAYNEFSSSEEAYEDSEKVGPIKKILRFITRKKKGSPVRSRRGLFGGSGGCGCGDVACTAYSSGGCSCN